MTRLFPLLALSFVACGPQNAKLVDAKMVGWLNVDTSFTLFQGLVDFENESGFDETWIIDCRELTDGDVNLEGGLPVCDPANGNPNLTETQDGQTWLNGAAWQGFTMDLDNAWRGEAIYTTERDLQVGFHQRLPGGEDFRFMFAIQPEFHPTECSGPTGSVEAVPVGGTPWLEAWAGVWSDLATAPDLNPFLTGAVEAFPDGQLYLLNGRSYQLNVNALGAAASQRDWTLPEEWASGFARGTFSREDMTSRPSRYANELIYTITDGGSGLNASAARELVWYNQGPAEALRAQEATRADLNRAMPAGLNANYLPLLLDNSWHEVDDSPVGLDNWTQLDYSWVVLSADSDPTPGGMVRGAFSILMDPDDSNSRFLLQGHFEVPRVKKERWGGRNLRAETLEASDDLDEDRCYQSDTLPTSAAAPAAEE